MGAMKHSFIVQDGEDLRLDKFLVQHLELSRSEIQANITAGRARVNGQVVTKKGWPLKPGDAVELEVQELPPLAGVQEDIPLDIRYEDQWLLVVNKPVGMVVHPAPGHHSGTLVNALLGYGAALSDLGGEFRPGIVHRLDKETSGLLMVAKTNSCHLRLAAMLKAREITRTYLALVSGLVQPAQGRITGPIGRHPRHRVKMAIVQGGKPAVTDFRVLRYFQRHSLVQVNLQTGRTHQIRVHFSHLGRPVVGDTVYGPKNQEIKYSGQMLHARTLEFMHPFLDKRIRVTAEPPPEFMEILRRLHRNEVQ